MIKVTNRLLTVFANRKTMEDLLECGFKLNKPYYFLGKIDGTEYLYTKEENPEDKKIEDSIPTMPLSDVLCILAEWAVTKDKDGNEIHGPLFLCKDAPFYIFGYELKDKDGNQAKCIERYDDLPLYGALSLLKYCVEHKEIGYLKGDISDIARRVSN